MNATLAPAPSTLRSLCEHPPAVSPDDWCLAQRIHRSFLPGPVRDERIDLAVHYEEHEVLGGDYCTALKTDDDRLFLCVCDVTGHGLAAAFLASRINSFVRHEITIANHPCEVVDTLNRFVAEHFAGLGLYATFLSVEIDLRWGKLTYAGAGHPPALLWRSRGEIERLGSLSPLIGIFPEMGAQCQVTKTFFQPGDRLLLFTDGLTETRNAAGEQLGIEAVEAVLGGLDAETDSETALAQIAAARRGFSRHGAPEDDVLVMAARFFSPPKKAQK